MPSVLITFFGTSSMWSVLAGTRAVPRTMLAEDVGQASVTVWDWLVSFENGLAVCRKQATNPNHHRRHNSNGSYTNRISIPTVSQFTCTTSWRNHAVWVWYSCAR